MDDNLRFENYKELFTFCTSFFGVFLLKVVVRSHLNEKVYQKSQSQDFFHILKRYRKSFTNLRYRFGFGGLRFKLKNLYSFSLLTDLL